MTNYIHRYFLVFCFRVNVSVFHSRWFKNMLHHVLRVAHASNLFYNSSQHHVVGVVVMKNFIWLCVRVRLLISNYLHHFLIGHPFFHRSFFLAPNIIDEINVVHHAAAVWQ
ncbi:hypothetical protein D3C85_1358330 [compost metagenome]